MNVTRGHYRDKLGLIAAQHRSLSKLHPENWCGGAKTQWYLTMKYDVLPLCYVCEPECCGDVGLAVKSHCKGQQLCKRFNDRAWVSKEGAAIIRSFGKVSKVLYSLLQLLCQPKKCIDTHCNILYLLPVHTSVWDMDAYHAVCEHMSMVHEPAIYWMLTVTPQEVSHKVPQSPHEIGVISVCLMSAACMIETATLVIICCDLSLPSCAF